MRGSGFATSFASYPEQVLRTPTAIGASPCEAWPRCQAGPRLFCWTDSYRRKTMEVLERHSGELLVRLTKTDLLILNNAVNEVCNGIDIPEFQTRIGVRRSE